NPETKTIGIVESASPATVVSAATENPRRRIVAFFRANNQQSYIMYFDTSGNPQNWNGNSWVSGDNSWGTLQLNTYYIYDLVSDGTSWYIRVSDASGNAVTTTSTIPWASVKNGATGTFSFYTGEVYTDYYWVNQKSDWLYLRNTVNPEPTVAVNPEELSGCTAPTPPALPGPAWKDCNWAYRRNITIDSTKVTGPGSLTNFPILIRYSSDPDLSGHAQSDGDDIFFTDSAGTTIPHEIEYYSAGTLVAWVKVPEVRSSPPSTVIFMYYGNPGVSSQQNPTAVWDTNYKGVWHMGEATGGSGAIKDSTTNGNHGTDYGGPTFGVSGRIGKAISFDGSNDYILGPDATSLDMTSQITMETWIYTSDSSSDQKIIGKTDYSSPYSDGYILGVRYGNLDPEFWDNTGTPYRFQSEPPRAGPIPLSAWTHLAVT
ncbi:MAG: DUF2341 domain-containing protein, partial [Methanomicrobiales archaeon]|nr:DUF2341 domain-containing protein [Methanomicrobiales archaeon]